MVAGRNLDAQSLGNPRLSASPPNPDVSLCLTLSRRVIPKIFPPLPKLVNEPVAFRGHFEGWWGKNSESDPAAHRASRYAEMVGHLLSVDDLNRQVDLRCRSGFVFGHDSSFLAGVNGLLRNDFDLLDRNNYVR